VYSAKCGHKTSSQNTIISGVINSPAVLRSHRRAKFVKVVKVVKVVSYARPKGELNKRKYEACQLAEAGFAFERASSTRV
jgi:hypothetical protein